MKKRINTKEKKSVWRGILPVLAVLTIAFCVFMTIDRVTSGAEMVMVKQEQETLEKDKTELQEKLVLLSSLNQLEKRASEYGFLKPQKVVYIQKDDDFVTRLP